MNSTLNFEVPPVLVFQIEVYYEVDRLLIGLTAQQKGTTARWYSNKTSLNENTNHMPLLQCMSRDSQIYVNLTLSLIELNRRKLMNCNGNGDSWSKLSSDIESKVGML